MVDTHLQIPSAHRPSWLKGMRLPVSKDEALEYAERHGAPPRALEFLETLPAAVFLSEEGMRHVFSNLDAEHIPSRDLVGDMPLSEDGMSS